MNADHDREVFRFDLGLLLVLLVVCIAGMRGCL